jgi:cell division protein FtsQ
MTAGRTASEPARPVPRSSRPAGPRRPQQRRRWRATLAVLGGAIAVGAVSWALLGSSLLGVRAVRLAGPVPVPRDRVLAAAGIAMGTPLLRVDTAAAARRIERITQVRSATVRLAWPDAIVIAIVPRTAELTVTGQYGYAMLDSDGVLLRWQAARPRGLALLLSPAAPVAELRGRLSVRAAGSVLAGLPRSLRRRVVAVRSSVASGVTLLLRGGITVRWGSTGRAAAKASELTALLRSRATYFDVSDRGTAVAGR